MTADPSKDVMYSILSVKVCFGESDLKTTYAFYGYESSYCFFRTKLQEELAVDGTETDPQLTTMHD